MSTVAQPSVPPRRVAGRWRRIGLIILLVGLAGAGGLWWQGQRAAPPALDDTSGQVMLDDSKRIARNNQLLYGKTASSLMGLYEDMTSPSSLALLVAAASVLGSFACFHLARLTEERRDVG